MSTARAPWHRLAGPAEIIDPVKSPLRRGVTGVCTRSVCECERDQSGDQCIWLNPIPPRLYPAGCDQQGRRLTREDRALAAEMLAEFRRDSDAEARALEESVEYPHEGSHRSASKVVAALFLAYLGGWATHAAMPWIAPALLRAMGITE
jgi:hypothetical protein